MSDHGDKLKKLLEDIKEKATEKSEEIRDALREHDHNKDEDSK